MSEFQYIELRIDKAFRNLIPPLSADEYMQLENSLLREGCRDPIIIWNGAIIDGHNRYEICLRHKIPFQIQDNKLQRKIEVIAWVCANQIGRRNLSVETRRYLIGRRYEAEKEIAKHSFQGNNQYTKGRSNLLFGSTLRASENNTARKLGEEYRLSYATVAKYGAYARAIDSMAKKNGELVSKILSGQTKISQDNLIEFAKLPAQELKRLGKRLMENDRDFVGYSAARKDQARRPGASKKSFDLLSETTVKDMPAFDPDAEISSLALTIPSWISLIERTRTASNLNSVSDSAKNKLANMLDSLNNAVDHMLQMIKE